MLLATTNLLLLHWRAHHMVSEQEKKGKTQRCPDHSQQWHHQQAIMKHMQLIP